MRPNDVTPFWIVATVLLFRSSRHNYPLCSTMTINPLVYRRRLLRVLASQYLSLDMPGPSSFLLDSSELDDLVLVFLFLVVSVDC